MLVDRVWVPACAPACDPMAKLLYFISEDWFFCSHFLERATAARDVGYEVVVLTRVGRHGDRLRDAGFRVAELNLDRSGVNVWRELQVLRRIWVIYRREKPDLVHHIALKPIFYGSLVARCLGIRAIVNAPVGMGYAFTASGARGQTLRMIVRLFLRSLLNPRGSKVVFENEEDLAECVAARSARAADAVLIPGAGVDTARFLPVTPPAGTPVVVMGSRMLRDKGVAEFVQAALALRTKGVAARFVLAGMPDLGNPSAVPVEQLQRWRDEGAVEWIGHCDDMAGLLQQSHLACLPSYYREGLPKFLLEAMACGLAVVSTDATGCRQAVEQGTTGLLVPPRDVGALTEALERLLRNRQERESMGRAGRERAQRLFDSQRVIRDTLALYAAMPGCAGP